MSSNSALDIDNPDGILRARFRAMASPCEILFDGGTAQEHGALLRQAAQETWRIERKFSRYREDSVISRINQANGGRIAVDGETARLLDFAARCWRISGGRFDITSGVLRRVWHFDGSDRLPTAADLEQLLPLIGWDKLRWNSPDLQMPAGMEIDLGGIGKEYAVDRVLERLAGQTDAPVLVNFGGDLRCSGPRGNSQAWQVGVEGIGSSVERRIALMQGALATSGDAHRFLLADGVRYSHILDPRSGWPVPNGPAAVTVAADTCSAAGLLSTLAMLQGPAAEDFLKGEAAHYWLRWS